MFEIISLEDSYINQYVFLTDSESIENQLFEIYNDLKKK